MALYLKDGFKLPLETTQIILIYSDPLIIRFQVDERKFDVDESYNIRFEIVIKALTRP